MRSAEYQILLLLILWIDSHSRMAISDTIFFPNSLLVFKLSLTLVSHTTPLFNFCLYWLRIWSSSSVLWVSFQITLTDVRETKLKSLRFIYTRFIQSRSSWGHSQRYTVASLFTFSEEVIILFMQGSAVTQSCFMENHHVSSHRFNSVIDAVFRLLLNSWRSFSNWLSQWVLSRLQVDVATNLKSKDSDGERLPEKPATSPTKCCCRVYYADHTHNIYCTNII